MTLRTCKECHQDKPHKALGFCLACYKRHRYKHHRRSLAIPDSRNPRKIRILPCVNCEETERIAAAGLCSTCYNYQKKHNLTGPFLPPGKRNNRIREEFPHFASILGDLGAVYVLAKAYEVTPEVCAGVAHRSGFLEREYIGVP